MMLLPVAALERTLRHISESIFRGAFRCPCENIPGTLGAWFLISSITLLAPSMSPWRASAGSLCTHRSVRFKIMLNAIFPRSRCHLGPHRPRHADCPANLCYNSRGVNLAIVHAQRWPTIAWLINFLCLGDKTCHQSIHRALLPSVQDPYRRVTGFIGSIDGMLAETAPNRPR